MNFYSTGGQVSALSTLLVFLFSFNLMSHEADPSGSASKYTIFGMNGVELDHQSSTATGGWVGSGPGSTLQLNTHITVNGEIHTIGTLDIDGWGSAGGGGSSILNENVYANGNVVCGVAQFNKDLQYGGSYTPNVSTVIGSITNSNPNVLTPDWPSSSYYPDGVHDVTSATSFTQSSGNINPGVYDSVTLTGPVNFLAGEYYFRVLNMNSGSKIHINKTKNEITRIIIKDHFHMIAGTEILTTEANDYGKVLVYVDTPDTVKINSSTQVDATIYAPSAHLHIDNSVAINGQTIAETIKTLNSFNGNDGSFIPFDPSKISLVGAATFSIPESTNTRFVNIPVELGGTMDSASSVQYIITEYHDPTSKAIGSGVDFDADTGIATSTGTIHFAAGSTVPNTGDSLWIQIIDDNLTSADINESDTEYIILKLFNPVVALLDADASAYEIDSTGSTIDTLTYRIPIINDDFNSSPIVSSDTTITVAEGASITFTINNNDPDLPADTTILSILGSASTGTASVNTQKDSVIYTHNSAEVFTDQFKVIVTDQAGATDTITINVIITPANDNKPVTNKDSINVNEGATATILVSGSNSLLTNDTDIDGMSFGPVVALKVSNPAHGILTINNDGTFSYIHDGTENFTDSFTYKTNDGVQDGNTVTVNITINALNDNAPVSNNDSINVNEGDSTTTLTSGSTSVLANDTDPDGMGPVTAILVSTVSNGTLTLNSDGTFKYVHNGTEIFTDSFTYKTNDDLQDGNTATVNITINSMNDNAPVSVKDSINVDEGGSTSTLVSGSTSVLTNDTDDDGMSGVFAIIVSSVTNGSLIFNTNGTFSYTHNGSENFSDSFTYKTNDGNQDGNTITVNISINPINDNKPVTTMDSINVNEGATATTLTSGSNSLLANDSDIDGMGFGPVIAIKVTNPLYGVVTVNSDGTFSYTHNGTENFTDSFTYKTNDNVQDGNTETVYITINPQNDNAPVSIKDSIHVNEGDSTTTLVSGNSSVLTNDIDDDGMSGVTAILVSNVTNGTLTLNSDGTFKYVHNGSENFTDSFIYKTNDGNQDGNNVTVNITINPLNDNAPISIKDSINVDEGATATTLVSGNNSVLTNDTDDDGMSGVIAILVGNPSYGSLNLKSDGTFSYTHNGSENFIDSFTYKTNDGNQDGNTVAVNISINPTNDNKPVTNKDSINVNEGASATTLVSGSNSLLANDSDIDGMSFGPVVAIKVSDPSYGTVLINSDGTFIYTHNGTENFIDSFTYKTNDGVQDGNTVTVNITINALNDNAPVTLKDSINVNEGATTTTLVSGNSSVLDNDTDADGKSTVTAILVTSVTNGVLSLNSDGTFSYTHNGSENLTDSFTYKTNDGNQDGNTVTVNITINPINDNAPVTVKDSINVDEGATATTLVGGNTSVLDNDSDTDGMSGVIAVVVSNPTYGSLTLNSDGSFSYVHNGSENFIDSFQYKTNDGIQDGNTVTINITINPINDNTPFAQVDVVQVASVGGTATILGNGNSSVLDNDDDVDLPYDSLFVKLTNDVSYGTFTLNGDGTFSYTHNGSGNLQDTAKYVTVDTAGTAHKSDTTLILFAITLTFTNKPDAENDSINVNEGEVATTLSNGESSLLWNDDPNDPLDDLEAFVVTQPSNGTVTINPGGTFSYTHDGSETTTDQFTYYINDLGNQKDTAIVFITITPVNDNTPVSFADTIIVNEGATATTLKTGGNNLLTNDTDTDPGDVLTASLATQAANGIASVNANGTFSYTHNDSELYTDQFTYTVTDAVGHSTNQVVIIIINPVNDNDPVIVSETITAIEGDTTDTTTSGSTTLLVNITDNDPGDIFSLDTIISGPNHGEFNIINSSQGTFEYIHDDSENFLDTVIYIISDAAGHEVTDTLLITIIPVNDNDPIGLKDSLIVLEGGNTTVLYDSVTYSILANDTDYDISYSLSALLLDTSGATPNGNVVLFPDGTFQYFHDNSENLSDSFSYIVSDGLFFDTAIVKISVLSINDNTPVSVIDTIIVNEGGVASTLKGGGNNLLANDSDVDPGDILTASLATQANIGVATINSNGTFTYTHNGDETYTDQFIYTVTDAAAHSTNQVVIIIVNPVNDNDPVIISETLTAMEGDTTTITTSGSTTLLVNITDTDPGDSFSLDTIIGGPNHGEFNIINSTLGTFEYIHDDSENFKDTVIYVISDAAGHQVTDTLIITITPVNDNAPIGLPDSLIVLEGGNTTILYDSLTLSVLDNDSDIDINYSLSVLPYDTSGSTPNGNVVLFPDGTFQYFHDNTENLSDSFNYIVSDGLFYDTVPVKVFVTSVNDNTPVSTVDTVIVDENGSSSVLTSGSINLLDNDIDVDQNDTLTASLLDTAQYGSIIVNTDGTFTYTHYGDEIFSDQFIYTVTDANNHSTNQVVFVVVNPVNDNDPIVISDSIIMKEGDTITTTVNGDSSLLENITDLDKNDSFTIDSIIKTPDHGTFIITDSVAGTFILIHDDSENFNDTVIYVISDKAGNTVIDTLIITIDPINDNTPDGETDSIVVLEGGITTVLADSITYTVMKNDSDIDINTTLEFKLLDTTGITNNGTITLNPDGTFEYIHDNSEIFIDSFTYIVSDGVFFDTVTVHINITPVNDNAPVPVSDTITLIEGQTVSLLSNGEKTVLYNDSDLDGMTGVTAIISDSTTLGSIKLNSDGTFSYTHTNLSNYKDYFTYYLSDGDFVSSEVTVYINITEIPKVITNRIATYHDNDGNGHIDSLFFEFYDPITLIDTLIGNQTNNDTISKFSLKWADGTKAYPITMDMITLDSSKIRMSINTSSLFSNLLRTSGDLLLEGKFTLWDPVIAAYYETGKAYTVSDNAAPVLTKAEYIFNVEETDSTYFDALQIEFSEEIKQFKNDTPFVFIKNNLSKYYLSLQNESWNSDRKSAIFRVVDFIDAEYASKTDSTWIFIDPVFDTLLNSSSFVSDLQGNKQKVFDNRKVPLVLEETPFTFTVDVLHMIGKEKKEIPEILQVGKYNEGVVMILMPSQDGNSQSIPFDLLLDLINTANIKAAVYDLVGNEVASGSNIESNKHLVIGANVINNKPTLILNWDGMNLNGRAVSAGAYVVIVNISDSDVISGSYKAHWNIKHYED